MGEEFFIKQDAHYRPINETHHSDEEGGGGYSFRIHRNPQEEEEEQEKAPKKKEHDIGDPVELDLTYGEKPDNYMVEIKVTERKKYLTDKKHDTTPENPAAQNLDMKV